MGFAPDRIAMKRKLSIDCYNLSSKELLEELSSLLTSGDVEGLDKQVLSFMHLWLSGRDEFLIRTSGSTGEPGMIRLERWQMKASARRSIQFFGLNEGDNLLLALAPGNIAAIMMMVRAMEGRMILHLRDPRKLSLEGLPQPVDFAALVPIQVEGLLDRNSSMSIIRKLIIGGAALDAKLRERLLSEWGGQAWETYGMTETLTHVAVRPVLPGNAGDPFRALPDVSFSLDPRGCLMINDGATGIEGLVSNDIALCPNPAEFSYIGRWDNVINSGGIKVSPEELEAQLQPFLPCDFCISSLPDDRLGRRIVLVLTSAVEKNSIDRAFSGLQPYYIPREIRILHQIPRNENGKIDRKVIPSLLSGEGMPSW
jgi:o-succinylbenzoate---CoA ligase